MTIKKEISSAVEDLINAEVERRLTAKQKWQTPALVQGGIDIGSWLQLVDILNKLAEYGCSIGHHIECWADSGGPGQLSCVCDHDKWTQILRSRFAKIKTEGIAAIQKHIQQLEYENKQLKNAVRCAHFELQQQTGAVCITNEGEGTIDTYSLSAPGENCPCPFCKAENIDDRTI